MLTSDRWSCYPAGMTEYGKIPPGYAPDWLLFEAARGHLFGRITDQFPEELSQQWRDSGQRAMDELQKLKVQLYQPLSDGSMIPYDLPDSSAVLARLDRMQFIWDEPGPFGVRLYIRSDEAADAMFWLPRDDAAKDIVFGGRPNENAPWLKLYDTLHPDGKDPSVPWETVYRELESKRNGMKLNPASFQQALRRRRRQSEKGL